MVDNFGRRYLRFPVNAFTTRIKSPWPLNWAALTGRPILNPVVAATPLRFAPPNDAPSTVVIDQVKKEFVPPSTAVQAGTAVSFPNHDNIKHHVYSFLPAKNFELTLYKGVPTSPVVLDKPGKVVLGCNIDDWMLRMSTS